MSVLVALCAACLWLSIPVQAGQPRIVSADGSITETVYALGAEDSLVGVDTTSNYPPEVRSQPRVGYLRALPFEGVLALRPDVLLTTVEAAPDRTLERLKQAGVEVIQLPVARSPEGAMARIREVGRVLGKGPEAETMVADIRKRVERIDTNTEGTPAQVLFLMAAGNHGVMIAGQDTAASALLDALGADNAMGDISGYKPAGREALLASRPDAIVVAESRPGQFDINQWPQLAALDAWKQGRYYIGDSMLLLGFGPRLPQAMEAVAGVLAKAGPVASAAH
ncbi:ABC transporter substrate-binding protein [Marinobacter sp. F3R11]|nr:ABC transporter substrate-binding protein [Marinobacter sp. F3R11]